MDSMSRRQFLAHINNKYTDVNVFITMRFRSPLVIPRSKLMLAHPIQIIHLLPRLQIESTNKNSKTNCERYDC